MTQRKILSLKKKQAPDPEPTAPVTPKPKRTPEEIREQEKKDRENKRQRIKKALKDLHALKLKYPFAIGSGKIILQMLKDKGHAVNPSRTAMTRFINSRSYQEKILTEPHRWNPDGSPAEEITEAQREYAKEQLKKKPSGKKKPPETP